MPIAIGFTGSRNGVSDAQVEAMAMALLGIFKAAPEEWIEAHHGDCVGADDIFDTVIAQYPVSRIVIHPPSDPKLRAYCDRKTDGRRRDLMPEKPYLDRNRDIVDACGLVMAAPEGPESIRSGTWSTVRYAKRLGSNKIVWFQRSGRVFTWDATKKGWVRV